MGRGEEKMAKSTTATPKYRKVAFDEFKNIMPELIAIAFTQSAFHGAGKIISFAKAALSGLGKLSGDEVDSTDVQKLSGLFKNELRKENMPKSYNEKLELLIDKYLDKTHGALIIKDDAERSLKLRELKRDLSEEVRVLDQQYQELSFEERIVPRLNDYQRKMLEKLVMAMSEKNHGVWNQFRERVKTVDMIGSALANVEGADDEARSNDFLNRLKVYLEPEPKADPKKEFEKGVKQVVESGKAVIEAFDKGIKDLFPYEELELPDFKDQHEVPEAYVERLVASGDLDRYRQESESLRGVTDFNMVAERNQAFIKRLLDEPKFMSKVDAKVNEFIRHRKLAKIRRTSTGGFFSWIKSMLSALKTKITPGP
ncbi:MAG: hypothetical protein P1P90_05020 [Patescibacteria group bacterium]|nr:hypothetical protein [Patescibacteria group bacterium]